MNQFIKNAIILLFVLFTNSNALLILAGDLNIAEGFSYQEGHRKFFTNILEGEDQVAITTGFPFNSNINDFYNSLSGVTSNIIQNITDAALSDVDLLVIGRPNKDFTQSELQAMDKYFDNGGSILFLGDYSAFQISNARINTALKYLGSDMRILENTMFDPGYNATGGQIAEHPLTDGITSFHYSYSSQVCGGTSLFYGREWQPFIAYESGTQSVQEPAVPELACLVILGLWLDGFALINKKIS